MAIKKSAAPVKKSPAVKTKRPSVGRTHVAIVLDNSSSIITYRLEATIKATTNAVIEGHKLQSKVHGLNTSLSLYLFDDVPSTVFENTDINVVPVFEKYSPYGSTALFDGVKKAIEGLTAFGKIKPHKKDAFLVIVITDGYENCSRYKEQTLEQIKTLTAQGNWTFAFQVPRGYANTFINNYGIPQGNVTEWEQTTEGAKHVADTTNLGTQAFYGERVKGATASQSYFAPDLSKVSDKKINKLLDDLSKQFRIISVPKEAVIKEFVEEKTHKPYVIGSTYYQLMKPETVQPQKNVLLIKKNTKEIFGGLEARNLIGLPQGVSTKVKPGNHADWDIFVASTSVNRVLVRGTRILVDKTKIMNDKPTWDHNAAAAVAVRK